MSFTANSLPTIDVQQLTVSAADFTRNGRVLLCKSDPSVSRRDATSYQDPQCPRLLYRADHMDRYLISTPVCFTEKFAERLDIMANHPSPQSLNIYKFSKFSTMYL